MSNESITIDMINDKVKLVAIDFDKWKNEEGWVWRKADSCWVNSSENELIFQSYEGLFKLYMQSKKK